MSTAASANRLRFEFMVNGWAANTFSVVRLRGEEQLSSLYHFELTVVCCDHSLQPQQLSVSACCLRINRDNGEQQDFHGMLSEVRILSGAYQQIALQITLVPRLWALSLGCYCKIFLNQSLPEILKTVLEDHQQHGVRPAYRLELTDSYPPREFVCQYNESGFNFLSRLMEQAGLYYYFEQCKEEEILVIVDNRVAHRTKPDTELLSYAPGSAPTEVPRERRVTSFVVIQRHLPSKLRLKGYNEERPAQPPIVEAQITAQGFGIYYRYGEHFSSRSDGERLAERQSQQLCHPGSYYEGESTASWLQPGYLMTLQDHFLEPSGQSYLITQVVHIGEQAAQPAPTDAPAGERSHYQNHFSAIGACRQYRALNRTPKPLFIGALTGVIDAAGSGQQAMLDKKGRYKVIFPFDLAEKSGGKASHWLRLAQPYGGSKGGMHFPLCKGTEVLIVFLHGDIDRPVISATLPNTDNPSLVTEKNAAVNKLCTTSGNELCLEDTAGRQSITLSSKNNTITMGDIKFG